MGLLDMFKSNTDDFSFSGADYNPTQSNVLGKDLAPVNPKGQLAAVDPSSDNRTSEQFKKDAQQANTVATNSPDEADSYHVSKSGSKYDKVDNSDLHQALTAAASYMTAYFGSGGNVGQAAMATGQAIADNDAKAHRLSQVDDLEAQGFNPMDIQNWINSGDKKDLVTNKGTWSSGGQGVIFNNLTGEAKALPGGNSSAPVKTVDLGDSKILYFADGTQQTVAKGARPTQSGLAVAGANGGGIGIDEDESQPQGFTLQSNGQWTKPKFNAKGQQVGYEVAGVKQTEQLNAQQNAGTPDPNSQLVSEDLNTVNAATPEQINRFTGQLIGRSETARDVATSLDSDTRKIYQASQRLSGQMGNAAIGAAKAAGASGINTEAEFKRFTASVPQLDYTSPENYKASVAKLQEYANNFRDSLIRGKGGNPAPQAQKPTNQLTDAELLAQYGG
ncbi:hypothetical protein GHH61_23590 [Salmonella enterica]|nr:hypothetical protein [Salmonella enterica]